MGQAIHQGEWLRADVFLRERQYMYKHFIKRLFDIVLSSIGIAVLALPMLIVSIVIFVDDPGPILFKQKRVGIRKGGKITYFKLWKFRTMKMSTPHDTPTHLLANPKRYITRAGRVLRKTSLDELPQIFNIFCNKLSIIGPRPALWNQFDLIAERDKYGANDVKPGLTGLAQISGRDELEIQDKAKLDGDYAAVLQKGGFKAFSLDCKCFVGTIASVFKHDGIVEGGTGEMKKKIKAAER